MAMVKYPSVDPSLTVLSDPAHVTGKAGTHSDFLIASSLLNSTVSGLLSRTFHRNDIIGPKDFGGAAFYGNLIEKDLTYHFIESVEREFDFSMKDNTEKSNSDMGSGLEEVRKIENHFSVDDIAPVYLTIVARGDHGGYMEYSTEEIGPLQTKRELVNRIRTALGRRAAELVYYGDEGGRSTSASRDLRSATRIAVSMIQSYGMVC